MHPFQDVVRDYGTLLPVVVIRILDMINAKVVKAANADGVKQQYAPCLGNERNLDGVKAETDGFACTKNSTKHANIMRELLRRVCDRANPVVDDVMPELLRRSSSAPDKMTVQVLPVVMRGVLTENTQLSMNRMNIQPNLGSSQSVGSVGGEFLL